MGNERSRTQTQRHGLTVRDEVQKGGLVTVMAMAMTRQSWEMSKPRSETQRDGRNGVGFKA